MSQFARSPIGIGFGENHNTTKGTMEISITELVPLIQSAGRTPEQPPSNHPSGQHIVVLDRGFVYVGNITVDCDYCRINNTKNIRVWGTSNGLGELRNGPLSSTKLVVVGDVIAPTKSVIHYIPCTGF